MTNKAELEALWELIGAINWISDEWESSDLALAVRHASELAKSIALKFPLKVARHPAKYTKDEWRADIAAGAYPTGTSFADWLSSMHELAKGTRT